MNYSKLEAADRTLSLLNSSVSELASLMDVSATEVISCFSFGVMVMMNQRLETDTLYFADVVTKLEFSDAGIRNRICRRSTRY